MLCGNGVPLTGQIAFPKPSAEQLRHRSQSSQQPSSSPCDPSQPVSLRLVHASRLTAACHGVCRCALPLTEQGHQAGQPAARRAGPHEAVRLRLVQARRRDVAGRHPRKRRGARRPVRRPPSFLPATLLRTLAQSMFAPTAAWVHRDKLGNTTWRLFCRLRRPPPQSASALSQAEQLHHWQANRRKLVRPDSINTSQVLHHDSTQVIDLSCP